MKKRVFDYIWEHPHVSIHEAASAIRAEELEVLKIVHRLEKEGYVKMDTPVRLSPENDNSCYYSTTGRKYANE